MINEILNILSSIVAIILIWTMISSINRLSILCWKMLYYLIEKKDNCEPKVFSEKEMEEIKKKIKEEKS